MAYVLSVDVAGGEDYTDLAFYSNKVDADRAESDLEKRFPDMSFIVGRDENPIDPSFQSVLKILEKKINEE